MKDEPTGKPDYFTVVFRIRCDGWWRKAIIYAVLFIVAVGSTSDLVQIIQSFR